jgi:trk system potassium uptake protein TrkH
LIDALFTATSAVCVTGLIVVDTGGYFTFFGQAVILLLIQLGGLGVMTVSVTLFRMLGRAIPFRQRMILQDVFAHTPRRDIFSLLKSIFLFTGAVEAAGAAALFAVFLGDHPWPTALWLAVFHSVSAFCNAGFSLFADSLMGYWQNLPINLTVCGLIVLGGIGFPVVYDLNAVYGFRSKKSRRIRLSVQTKTVLLTSGALIVLGAVLFYGLEHGRHLRDFGTVDALLASLFQSITTRTAGFNTLDIAALREPTLVFMIFLMFVGASPGSCGGGIKTTTLALIGAFSLRRLRRGTRVNLFKKSIPEETVQRSLTLILISIATISFVFFMLLVGTTPPENTADGGRPFLSFLFETVSAFGTVGLSMGATSELNLWGKIWIIAMMLVGRVGILTFSYMLIGAGRVNGLEHAEENVMVG